MSIKMHQQFSYLSCLKNKFSTSDSLLWFTALNLSRLYSKIQNLVKKGFDMYNHSGCSRFYGGTVQGMGQGLPLNSGLMFHSKANRNYFMDSGGVSIHCPIRKVHCGELRLQDAGYPVEICGKMQDQRLGRFLSLKDDTGITQLVVPDERIDIQKKLRNLPLNSFLVLRGFVTARPDKSRNEKMATGDIEILIENLVSVQPKRKKDDSYSDDGDINRYKKKASINSAYSKLTSEELSKCPTPALIKHFSQRSHTCGELSRHLVGKTITLCGWVSAKRIERFVVLKDGYGSVQIVPDIQNVDLITKFQNLQIDYILVVKGVVSRRPPEHENPRVDNGTIEVLVESLRVVSPQDFEESKGSGSEGDEDGNGDDSRKKPVGILIKQEEVKENQAEPNPNKFCDRSHTCGELNESNVGQNVRLMGWIEFNRMNKFILLRDKYGRTQLVLPDSRNDLQDLMRRTPLESVILVEGTVCSRPPGQENTKQSTGYIEVIVKDLKVLSLAKSKMPFYSREFKEELDVTRMKYRYIDLRRSSMQNNLRLRSKVVHKMRRFLVEELDFLEVETPTLFKRTPGGAQEFIVPTRVKDKYYALVQSPQQFKQLLMVGSVDRYFQFARCYRDESVDGSRQPEFTQLDLELSFCDRDHIFNLIEDLMKYCWPENFTPLSTPFPRLTYEEAMNSYGTDKPDLRFDWKIKDLTQILKKHKDKCKGKIDVDNILCEKNFSVRAFVGLQGSENFTNSTKKSLLSEIQKLHQFSSFYFFPVKNMESTRKALESLFSEAVAEEIEKTTNFENNDVLFMGVGPEMEVLESLGKLRVIFAEYLEKRNMNVIQKNAFKFLWVQDFPLFLEKNGEIVSCHHPFTQVHPNDFHLLEREPLKVKSLHYDLVLNGNEIGGGSIRIHDAEVQKMILEKILNIEIESLSHLLDALESGAPPHGGIALGLDRLISILCGAQSIKEVIAFPKSRLGHDVMAGAPCSISSEEKEMYFLNKDS